MRTQCEYNANTIQMKPEPKWNNYFIFRGSFKGRQSQHYYAISLGNIMLNIGSREPAV